MMRLRAGRELVEMSSFRWKRRYCKDEWRDQSLWC